MRHRTFALAAGLTAVCTVWSAAGVASAAPPPPISSNEQAGVAAFGAQFRYVQSTSSLRNPAQYASYFHLYRYSLQLRSPAQVLQFYVGTNTGSRTYRACAKIYNPSTHTLTRDLGCGGSFPAGDTVTESISYNPDTHMVSFRARDSAGATVHVSFADTAQSFRQARIGIELGPNPWSSPSLTRSPSVLELGRFTNCTLTSYSGHTDGFISWWDYNGIWLKNGFLGKAGLFGPTGRIVVANYF